MSNKKKENPPKPEAIREVEEKSGVDWEDMSIDERVSWLAEVL